MDYLIANTLWIRSGNAISSGHTGHITGSSQELINQLVTKELGYFLGISLDPDEKVDAVNTVIGASNVFFVIDNLLLYPTWRIVQNIKDSLMIL
jgi:hypothetical protein